MTLPQTLTLQKITNRFNKDKLFVTVADFDVDRVIIGKSKQYHNATSNDNISYQTHSILYIYSGDSQSKSAIIEPLRLYCKNLKIRNVRLFCTTRNNTYIRFVKFPFDNDANANANAIDTKIQQIIHDIKQKIIQDINIYNNISKDSADKMLSAKDQESIGILVGPTGDLTSNIFLSGSNESINTIKNLQSIIKSSKYKRVDSCDCVLMFNTTITVKMEDDVKDESISFRGLVDVMEMYYDRSLCASSYKSSSILEPRDKIVVFDNTLVL